MLQGTSVVLGLGFAKNGLAQSRTFGVILRMETRSPHQIEPWYFSTDKT